MKNLINLFIPNNFPFSPPCIYKKKEKTQKLQLKSTTETLNINGLKGRNNPHLPFWAYVLTKPFIRELFLF